MNSKPDIIASFLSESKYFVRCRKNVANGKQKSLFCEQLAQIDTD